MVGGGGAELCGCTKCLNTSYLVGIRKVCLCVVADLAHYSLVTTVIDPHFADFKAAI